MGSFHLHWLHTCTRDLISLLQQPLFVRDILETQGFDFLGGSNYWLQIITSGVAGGDRGVMQRLVALISRPLTKWADLRIPSYAEWVGCKVQSEYLSLSVYGDNLIQSA